MTRSTRTLLSSGSAADPPEAVVTVQSDFVVILAALLCALIAVVGLIAVARCAFLRRGGSNDNRTNPAANKGVKKRVLNSLPKFTYTAPTTGSHAGGGVVECAKFAWSDCVICLGEFNEGDEIRVLPQCGHGFHVGCIDTWLGSHSSCPSCRQILVVTRCRNCGHFPNTTNSSSSSSCSSSTTVDGGSSHEVKASEDPSNSNCRNHHSNSRVNSGSFLP